MTRNQASCICMLLEVATEGQWPVVAETITNEEHGYTPANVISAWEELEKISGIKGTAPEPADFS